MSIRTTTDDAKRSAAQQPQQQQRASMKSRAFPWYLSVSLVVCIAAVLLAYFASTAQRPSPIPQQQQQQQPQAQQPQAPPSPSPSPSPFREELVAFYTEHNPSKVAIVDKVLRKYAGHERELLIFLRKKYNVAVDEADEAPPAPPSFRTQLATLTLDSEPSAFDCSVALGGTGSDKPNEVLFEFLAGKAGDVAFLPLHLARPAAPFEPGRKDDASRVAVLIEPRRHPCVGFVVRALMHNLEHGAWGLQIFHGPDNLDYIKAQLGYNCTMRRGDNGAMTSQCARPGSNSSNAILDRISFDLLPPLVEAGGARVEALPEKQAWLKKEWRTARDAMSAAQTRDGSWNLQRVAYSQLLLSPDFWQAVRGEHTLVFQTDAWLCRPGLEQHQVQVAHAPKDTAGHSTEAGAGTMRTIDLDYLGAPWGLCYTNPDSYLCFGGNGGLSLRRRSAMLRVIKLGRRSTINEDYQFASWLRRHGPAHGLASFDASRNVFVENLPTVGKATVPFGLHKAWAYLDKSALRGLLNSCLRGVPSVDQVAVL